MLILNRIASLVPGLSVAKNRIGLLSFRISNAIFAYRKITQFTTGEVNLGCQV
jgi:hypothetical protein